MNQCLPVYVPQISYFITGNGAVSPDLHKRCTEAVHSPQIITTLWISGTVSPVLHTHSCIAITWFPHSPTIYCHYITHVCLYKYVCVFISDLNINFSFMHTPTHIQHIVICKSFTVGITTGWCLYFKLVILMCYFKITLSYGYNKLIFLYIMQSFEV